jgi:hypothetical protein
VPAMEKRPEPESVVKNSAERGRAAESKLLPGRWNEEAVPQFSWSVSDFRG